MRPNRLRQLLDAGRPSLGTHVHSPWPSVVEMVGHSGQFDYVEYVAEYAPHDLHTFDNIGRAIDLFPDFSGMIKVEQGPSAWLASRAIGAGIQNVLFADVRSADEARAAVAAVRADLPGGRGDHGVTARRYTRFGIDAGTPEFLAAHDDVVVAIMIEKQSAVDDLDAILSVEGLDMVQFGPADYALNVGHPRQYGHPEVLEAEVHVIERALAHGVHPRVELPTAAGFERHLDAGVRHFCVGTDVSILMDWFRREGAGMRTVLDTL
jgi:2-keto-3-deoxy-L-rhamnonate aldolase RhmA